MESLVQPNGYELCLGRPTITPSERRRRSRPNRSPLAPVKAASWSRPILGAIPAALTRLPRWIVWDGGKVPFDAATATPASSVDADTWTTFDRACGRYVSDEFAGVGFMLGNGIVGVDLDDCVHDGAIEPWAQAIIDRLDSYTELSPSGRGVHILVYGKKPGTRSRVGNVEIYDHARYFCMTGRRVAGTPEAVNNRSAALKALYAATFA